MKEANPVLSKMDETNLDKACLSKVPYKRRREAQKAVASRNKRCKREGRKFVYECKYCGNFHLATKGKSRKKIGPTSREMPSRGKIKPPKPKKKSESKNKPNTGVVASTQGSPPAGTNLGELLQEALQCSQTFEST